MSEFIELDAKVPATLGAIVEAITRLSTLGEAEILELVSAGKIQEIFPFRPNHGTDVGPDFVAEEDLVEATPEPLTREKRAAHIEASMPGSRKSSSRVPPGRARKQLSKR